MNQKSSFTLSVLTTFFVWLMVVPMLTGCSRQAEKEPEAEPVTVVEPTAAPKRPRPRAVATRPAPEAGTPQTIAPAATEPAQPVVTPVALTPQPPPIATSANFDPVTPELAYSTIIDFRENVEVLEAAPPSTPAGVKANTDTLKKHVTRIRKSINMDVDAKLVPYLDQIEAKLTEIEKNADNPEKVKSGYSEVQELMRVMDKQ